MPMSAPKHCPHGHPPHRERRCPMCVPAYRAASEAKRPSARERGYDSRWQKARKAYLFEHPLCVECGKEGRLIEATVVDHVKPHQGDEALFWDRSNWQSSCRACHNRKTARQDGGYGNRRG